jgi:hypothetical protein
MTDQPALVQYVQFYDSSQDRGHDPIPAAPADATHAALYGDGDFQADPADAKARFKFRRWITVLGTVTCGLADFEPGNEIYGRRGALRQWATDRLNTYRDPPVVYVDRALASQAVADLDGLRTLFWIPTADNRDWTPQELAADLAANWNAPIPAAAIWGNQNVWAPGYDRSNLFGVWWA